MSTHDRFFLSRRAFLGGLAAIPIAAQAEGRRLFAGSPPRIVVIGAGAFGSWTALHLLRLGADVTLLDAWGAGNSRSSSGGESRVIRAIYGPDRIYTSMVKRSYELWEALIESSTEPLYVETGALWMHRGDDSYVQSSRAILEDLGFPLERLTVEEAARRYPQIRFEGVRSVWMELRAGALLARRACEVVRDRFVELGGVYETARAEPGEIRNGTMREIRSGSPIEADHFVFACGPWLGRIFPDLLGRAIRPTRQEVHYFGVPAGSQRYTPQVFPVWIDFGERILYGLPDLHGRGIKVADDTRGETVDPTTMERKPTAEGIAHARALLAERFPELAEAPLVESRVCQYENSPDGHLILDRHPEARNVWIAGGGSGHGFKLSPAVGEMTAEAILDGRELPELFRLERLSGQMKSSTQFESKEG